MDEQSSVKHFDISYNALRKCMGWLAMMMPLLLWGVTLQHGHCNEILSSISSYHHTHAGHIFTAITVLMAVVFYIYKGYDNDYIFMRVAALLALGIAFIPNEQSINVASCIADKGSEDLYSVIQNGCFITYNESVVYDKLHLVCAVGFFIMLSYICLFRFTKSSKTKANFSTAKKKRNSTYMVCAMAMIIIMVLLGIYFLGRESFASWLTRYDPIFWGEWAMIWAFGIAWLTKGQAWMKD